MINKHGFADYLAGMGQVVEGIHRKTYDPLLNLTEVVTQEEGCVLTAWCSWAVPGTPKQGSGLIKVVDQGIISERLFYYTKLPEAQPATGLYPSPTHISSPGQITEC